MRRLALRAVWRLLGRRVGWMALATAARAVLRRGSSRQVDEATAELEARLPIPVGEALTALPGDPLRVGGRALVASRTARRAAEGAGRAAEGAGRASRAANEGRRRVGRGLHRATALVGRRPRPVRGGRRLVDRIEAEVRSETAETRRQLRSQMLANSRGRAAADDALLDRREIDLDRGEIDLDRLLGPGADPSIEPPAPVRAGRRRAPRRRSAPVVPRVQRTYRPPRRAWDR